MFLVITILASFILFLTVSYFHRFNRKLDFFGFLGSLGFFVHCLWTRFSLSDLCAKLLDFRSPKCFRQHVQDLIPLLISQLACVLLLQFLVAKTSSSLCGECSCQLLFVMQLPSRLKTLCTVKIAASGSGRQTRFVNPILSIFPS